MFDARKSVAAAAVLTACLVVPSLGCAGSTDPSPRPDGTVRPERLTDASPDTDPPVSSCAAVMRVYAQLLTAPHEATPALARLAPALRHDLVVLADAYGRYARAVDDVSARDPGLDDAAGRAASERLDAATAVIRSARVTAAARDLDRTVVGPCP
jgi:hypothetical protein